MDYSKYVSDYLNQVNHFKNRRNITCSIDNPKNPVFVFLETDIGVAIILNKNMSPMCVWMRCVDGLWNVGREFSLDHLEQVNAVMEKVKHLRDEIDSLHKQKNEVQDDNIDDSSM